MAQEEEASFANPQPPPNYKFSHPKDDSHPLTNADFRKLLMTPSASSHRPDGSVRGDASSLKSKGKLKSDGIEKRREKKQFYATLVKESKEREVELAKRYRDRAKERREIKDGGQAVTTTSNFKAVAPDVGYGDTADRRRQIIEESKYLGGDLEHTHLVKGLDYALLQKIKAELDDQNDEVEERLEKQVERDDDDDDEDDTAAVTAKKAVVSKVVPKHLPKPQIKETKEAEPTTTQDDYDEDKVVFKSKLARGIYRAVFRPELPKVNELFIPRRMAYVIDLDDEETDIPITLTRSKADCPNPELNATISTNDIVINKLTQILSYLRQGGGKRDLKKPKRKEVNLGDEFVVKKEDDLGIYDDIDDYVPDMQKRVDLYTKKETAISRDKPTAKKSAYFSAKDDEPERDRFRDSSKEQGPSKEAANAFIKSINEKYSNKVEPKKEEKKMTVKFDTDSYAECYPGTIAEDDVNVDSDEEPDFDKMDLGNKKGPVNRWDFDTPEEYDTYMSNREALPKAAFQYGMKMNDGRKTRRADPKNEKAKIDKEWNEISRLIDKRKSKDVPGDYKKPKY